MKGDIYAETTKNFSKFAVHAVWTNCLSVRNVFNCLSFKKMGKDEKLSIFIIRSLKAVVNDIKQCRL